MSHPLGVRELKLCPWNARVYVWEVAPFRGA